MVHVPSSDLSSPACRSTIGLGHKNNYSKTHWLLDSKMLVFACTYTQSPTCTNTRTLNMYNLIQFVGCSCGHRNTNIAIWCNMTLYDFIYRHSDCMLRIVMPYILQGYNMMRSHHPALFSKRHVPSPHQEKPCALCILHHWRSPHRGERLRCFVFVLFGGVWSNRF